MRERVGWRGFDFVGVAQTIERSVRDKHPIMR